MSEKKVTLSILTYYDERLKEWVLEQIGEGGYAEAGTLVLRGTIATYEELPTADNKVGDIYLVGPAEDGTYGEYIWTEANAWEFLGSASKEADLEAVVTKAELYAGQDNAGTPENPAEDSILGQIQAELDGLSNWGTIA